MHTTWCWIRTQVYSSIACFVSFVKQGLFTNWRRDDGDRTKRNAELVSCCEAAFNVSSAWTHMSHACDLNTHDMHFQIHVEWMWKACDMHVNICRRDLAFSFSMSTRHALVSTCAIHVTCMCTHRRERVAHMVYPLNTVLDDSIGCALWFAARGDGLLYSGPLDHTPNIPYHSRARVREGHSVDT